MQVLHHSVVMKRELSKKVNLSIFITDFVPILTYGHESWEMTRKSVITGASVRNEVFYEELKEFHCLTRCIALRLKNILTSSRYLFELKYLSLDGLAM